MVYVCGIVCCIMVFWYGYGVEWVIKVLGIRILVWFYEMEFCKDVIMFESMWEWVRWFVIGSWEFVICRVGGEFCFWFIIIGCLNIYYIKGIL